MATVDDLADFLLDTEAERGEKRFTDISTDLQKYEVMSDLLREERVLVDAGDKIERNVLTKDSGAARHTDLLFSTDSTKVLDGLDSISVDWKAADTHWVIDEFELSMNKGKRQLLNKLQIREHMALVSLAKELEAKWWSKPASTSETKVPFGIDYWLVSDATEGFNGGAPAGFPLGAGGLLHDNFKNYTFAYTSVDRLGLYPQLRRAHRKTDWRPPVSHRDYRRGRGRMYRWYTNDAVITEIESVAETSNENLGREMAPYYVGVGSDGAITFRGHPVVYIPYLDADGTDPIYGVDWSEMHAVVHEEWNLKRRKPERLTGFQHTVVATWIDLRYNFICTNRRSQIRAYRA